MQNNKLWFKAKNYGYGWYPSSWEGWGVMLLYFVVIAIHVLNVEKYASGSSDILLDFIVPLLINTIFLIIICWAKGEKAEWRWGGKKS